MTTIAEVEADMTTAIPIPVIRKLGPIEAPLTERVYPVDAPTLTLHRVEAGWRSEDGGFTYPTTAHMLADWVNGVAEIPDVSPFEKARDYFAADTSLPYEVRDVTQETWDHARNIIEEVKATSLVF